MFYASRIIGNVAILVASSQICGCGAGLVSTETSTATANAAVTPVIAGTVQTASPDFFRGATVQLLAVGMVNGAPLFEVVGNPVAADSSGSFSVSASASCTSPDEDLFAIALSARIADPALVADIGKCGTALIDSQNIVITETTTLSAVDVMASYL